MAASLESLEDNDMLSCAICLFGYDDNLHQPKLLPCHHTYCKDCLLQLAQNHGGFDCPTCRSHVSISDPEGIAALQVNFYITHMKEMLSLQRPKKKAKGCRVHINQPLNKFCMRCESVICVTCHENDHQGHIVRDVSEAMTEQKRTVELEISEAQGRILSNIALQKNLESEISNLFAAKEAGLQCIDRTFDGLIQALNRRRTKLKDTIVELYRSRRDAVLKNLEESRAQSTKLGSAIQQCENAMVSGNISEILSTRAMMTAKRSELQRLRPSPRIRTNFIKFDGHQGEERFFSCLHDLGKVTCEGMLPSIVDLKSYSACASLFSRITMMLFSYGGDKIELANGEDPSVTVDIKDPDEHLIRNMVSYKGNGLFEIIYRPHISGNHYVQVKFRGQPIKSGELVISVKSNDPVMKFGLKGERGGGEFLYPRAIAVDKNNNVYVVDTGNCCIQKFNPSGEFVCQFPVCKENDALSSCGIAINHEADLLICTEVCVDGADLSAAHAILVYTLDGELVKRFTDQTNMKRGLCIAVNSVGFMVIADLGNNCLLMYDNNGRFVKRIGMAGAAAGQFNYPTFVCIGQDDRIIVADADNNRIQVFDRDGQYLFHFGSRGTGKGRFNQPFGVGADEHGNILVVDSGNKRIQVFKQDGIFVSCIESAGDCLLAPRGISVTKDGHVWVADRDNHCMKKFRYT